MKASIKDILRENRIMSPGLVMDLEKFFTQCMRASKTFGKKVAEMDKLKTEDEEDVFQMLRSMVKDPSDYLILEHIENTYGLYRKNGNKLQSPRINGETIGKGYSLRKLSETSFPKKANETQVPLAPQYEFPLRTTPPWEK